MRLLLFGMLLLAGAAYGGVEVLTFKNETQEQRYRTIISELRCLVCQNQNLADSDADLAKDLRREIYQMVRTGSSDEEVIDFMVSRYGDFVLYRPPFTASTALLWIGPFIILAAGIGALLRSIRRRARKTMPELSKDDHERARRLLQTGKEDHT